jgi:thiamine-monophosphate kinase
MTSSSKPLSEFELIRAFFKSKADAMDSSGAPTVVLGIGDDCALFSALTDEELAITSDMLVEDRHFFSDANPEWLGYKALAVNLSDLAAMGAKPQAFTLAIAMPHADTTWLQAFSAGLFRAATEFSCPLIGGDTCQGPLNICITAFGSAPKGSAIRRSGAKPGDQIWVSGTLGDARLTLAALRHEIELFPAQLHMIESRLHQPSPRIHLGIGLRNLASAALDISDGLLGDLQHLLDASQVDGTVFLKDLPKSATLLQQSQLIQDQYAACGGDDYEICFTASAENKLPIEALSKKLGLELTCIGEIQARASNQSTITLIDRDGQKMPSESVSTFMQSFDHFA